MSALDWTVLHWIHDRLHCGFLDFLMPRITLLGNGGAVWVVIALILLCIRKHRRTGLALLMGLGAGVLIGNLLLKPLIARPRPCWIDQTTPLLIACPTDFSFPSGHTLSSVIAAAILCGAPRVGLDRRSVGRCHRLFPPVSVCSLSHRRAGGRGAGHCHRPDCTARSRRPYSAFRAMQKTL